MELACIDDIYSAAKRIAPFVSRTPVLTSPAIDEWVGAEVRFKCENLQPTGAFKLRGATNAVQILTAEQAANGVATHSSGNHGAALAAAAQARGIDAHVVMPNTAPATKQANVARYGANIHLCEPTLQARERTLESLLQACRAHPVHPYDDNRVIAGQGTAALELLTDHPDLELILVPIGGGGLAGGTALATKSVSPATRVIAVEPKGADDAYRSWQQGKLLPSSEPRTIADGLLTSVGERNFALLRRYLDDVVTVTEQAIIDAMQCLFTHLRVVVEPSAAVPLAALHSAALGNTPSRIGIILSGGNVDLNRLPWQAGNHD